MWSLLKRSELEGFIQNKFAALFFKRLPKKSYRIRPIHQELVPLDIR